ncbi:NmrA-like family-domain-containing protein [Armillaria luteobubalina]|uniref:NmrA-like family-domain-containing protein n=1 Tax=Armillaria luteobubalina TaxID=153913 RepID=A0AA39Q1L6_9AGAR|nr:NmrA-like family-domain-containing protein [Armillaria luteobubalina]
MSYKSFALIGANGLLGKHILNALITENIPVLILTRKTSDSSSNIPATSNIKIAKVDYKESAEISAVLKENNVDVVISAVKMVPGGKSQYTLTDSAKVVGVKLFVLSEFGNVTARSSLTVYKEKDDFAKYLKKIGLPSARIYTGVFFVYIPAFVGYHVNQKFNIVGKGHTKASFSALEDIGGFVVHIITHLPAEQLNDKMFCLQSEGLMLVELTAKVGLPPNHVDKLLGDLAESFMATAQGLIEGGQGSTRWDYEMNKESVERAGSANALWPGHEWKTITPALFSK